MAYLVNTFENIYKDVSRFMGLGSSPAGDDLTLVKDITYRGYIKFLTAVHPRTGQLYRWSFLKKSAVLNTVEDQHQYALPIDAWHVEDELNFDAESGYPTIKKRSLEYINSQRAQTVFTSYPNYFAVVYGDYDKTHIQRKQLVFYPTPDQAYSIVYEYYFIPPKPENDDDYFVGGPEISEAIRLCALSVAEMEEDEAVGTMSASAIQMLNQLIRADEVINVADTVGPVVGMESVSTRDTKDFLRSIQELEEVYGIAP